MDAAEARALFEQELDTVETVLDWVSRERFLDPDEADSFRSHARLRLMDNEFAVIRKFSGRSSLRTFLVAVVSNAYVDYKVSRWGKWRPSAAALRMGRTGRLLDTYLNRDNHPLEEAIQRLLSRDDVPESEAELRRMAALIPRRARRVFTSVEHAPTTSSLDADAPLMEEERDRVLSEATAALDRAMANLTPQDRTIVSLHVREGMTLAAVARTMRIDQKPLYRRFHRALAELRKSLQDEGVDQATVQELFPT